jgi:enoyl-CoA hydratase/carnithine racemase
MAELIVRRAGPVATVVFSNVERHNAVTYEMWRDFPQRMAELGADPEVRVIVIAGDGTRAFIAGADISQFERVRNAEEAQAEYNRAVDAAYAAPALCAKPVIAKIRGICFGGGLGLAAACDVRMCSDDSTFRMPAARMGLGYSYLGIRRFMQVLGAANTADIFYSARRFDAADALRMGLVSRVVPGAELDASVDAWTAMVAENAPLTIAAGKRAIREVLAEPAERDLAGLAAMVRACALSEDYREGRTAFMEKRAPRFTGK